MTNGERGEIAALRDALLTRLDTLDQKVDAIESRLDRWDGAITLIKAAAGVVGFGGLSAIIAALAANGKGL